MEWTCAFLINHPNKEVPQTINNYDHIPVGLCVISHESFKIGFWKLVFQHHFIKFCPHKSLSCDVFKLHIIDHYGQHFTIDMIIHMTSHNCPTNNTFHMIKHDPTVLQIPYRLHSSDKANSTLDTIYWHLENKHILSMNLSWETSLLVIVIPTLGLKFKDAFNIANSWMTLERSNKVMNVGRAKFTKLVLDVFQLLTLDELHCVITRIIKQVTCQECLISTRGNRKDLCITCAIHLLYNQPSSLFNKLSTFSIHNKMVVNTKMNRHFWHKLESMHNIIDLPTIIHNIEGRSMTKFSSKHRSRANHCHLTYDWNKNALTTLEGFITKGKVHKVFTIILHTPQVTQATSLPKSKPKWFFLLVMPNLHQAWSSYFSSMTCIWEGLWMVESIDDNSNKTSPSKIIDKN